MYFPSCLGGYKSCPVCDAALAWFSVQLLLKPHHRGVKRITNAALGYKSFHTAWRTIRGIEIMRMIYKGQVEGVNSKDVLGEKKFVESLFGIAI